MLAPILLNVIVLNGDVAVNLYHTSAPGVAVQLLATVGLDTVAPARVPAGGVPGQAVPAPNGVKVITPEQSSFAGGALGAGCVTQISKLPVVEALSDPTLIR